MKYLIFFIIFSVSANEIETHIPERVINKSLWTGLSFGISAGTAAYFLSPGEGATKKENQLYNLMIFVPLAFIVGGVGSYLYYKDDKDFKSNYYNDDDYRAHSEAITTNHRKIFDAK